MSEGYKKLFRKNTNICFIKIQILVFFYKINLVYYNKYKKKARRSKDGIS